MKATIKFNNVQQIQEFVNSARNCPFNIDVQYRHYILDGKSLVGLLSMDLTEDINVYYNGTSIVFETMLEQLKTS